MEFLNAPQLCFCRLAISALGTRQITGLDTGEKRRKSEGLTYERNEGPIRALSSCTAAVPEPAKDHRKHRESVR